MTSSAMLVAWSPTRSRLREMRMSDGARPIVAAGADDRLPRREVLEIHLETGEHAVRVAAHMAGRQQSPVAAVVLPNVVDAEFHVLDGPPVEPERPALGAIRVCAAVATEDHA